MKKMEIRCIHRKTIIEHPSCFVKGRVKLPIEAKGYKIKKNGEIEVDPWWADPRIKIGFFDIETTHFKADIGIVLSWVIKEKDIIFNTGNRRRGKIIKRLITKEELLDKNVRDKFVVKDFIEALEDFDIIVGYNSKRFDIPFMKARALKYSMMFPEYGSKYHFDLLYHVRRNMALTSRTLGKTTRFLGIEGKNHVLADVWVDAIYGDEKALEYVLDHNVRDVLILEELFNIIYPYSKWTKTSI